MHMDTHAHKPQSTLCSYKQTKAPQARKRYCKRPTGPLQLLYKESVCVTWKRSAATGATADVWI